MKIVVTGALGHIGSRLVRELAHSFPEARIVLLDNLASQRYCSLFDLPGKGRFQFHEADVLLEDLVRYFDGAEAVVHLAALANAAESFTKKEQVEKVNVLGTEKVARACLTIGCGLIFASTTSVYGSQSAVVDEDCPAADLKPQSPYAESKLRAEQLLQNLGDSEGLRFVICRFGTVFGVSPGMRFDTAVNKFCWQAAHGRPVTVWRSALHQLRPYLDLSDCTEAVAFLIRRALYERAVYNVLTLNATVSQVLREIERFVADLSIQLEDVPIMNQLSYQVSDSRFKAMGFAPRGDLTRGIEETLRLLGAYPRTWR